MNLDLIIITRKYDNWPNTGKRTMTANFFLIFFPLDKENYHILNLYNKAFDVTVSHLASSWIGLGDPPWKV